MAVIPAVVVAAVWRRWWIWAAVLSMAVGMGLAAIQAAAIRDSGLVEGRNYDVAVKLISATRTHDGTTGPWWTAKASVVGGAKPSTVSVSGRGVLHAGIGDRLTASVTVAAARSPGEAAQLRVRGQPDVDAASGPSASVRERMRELAGDTDAGWLLSGMSLGMDEGLSESAQHDMRVSGLSHLTAVSGANCAVLLVIVHWIGGWLRLRRIPRALCAGAVLSGFVVTVGLQPSVLRAAVMAGLALVAGLVGGRRAAAHVLQMSVILLLLVDPWLAYSVGFMLSIAATAGLIALLERGPLAATVAAQVATFPILIAVGGSVGVRTVVSNVVVAPLAALIPLVGLASVLVDWLTGLGAPIAAAGRGLCALVLRVAHWDVLPNLSWLPGWPGVMVAAMVALTVLGLGRRRLVVVTAVAVGAVSMGARFADAWPPPDWWLVACDVGQGDGFVVRSQGRVVVVDTGPEPVTMDQCLDRLGVQAVDLLVITHFHADHVGGLEGVVADRPVGQVWVSPCHDPSEQFAQAQVELAHQLVVTPVPGQHLQVGDMTLNVVWPQRVIAAGSVPNNASVSFMLTAPQGRVAFLGDIEPEAQTAILAGADLSADIVKVPHHGSAQFVPQLPGAVHPQIALIGVGEDNTFGHPTPEAIGAWQQVGATVFTTELNGDIAVTAGRSVVVRGVSRQPAR